MHSSIRHLWVGILVAALTPVAVAADAAPSPQAAKDLVAKVTSESVAILRDKSLTKEQKNEKVQKLALDVMDFETTARMSMGPAWRNLSDAQKAEFSEVFKKRLMISYSHTTDEYTDEGINVGKVRQENNGDFTVSTTVVDPTQGNKEVAKVEYRLRPKNGQVKFIDVIIDGVSIITNYRSQFQDVMANGGFDKLLKLLRDKNEHNEK